MPINADRQEFRETQSDLLSCVVQTRPNAGREVAERLANLVGVEIHGGAEVDKLILTIEDAPDFAAADRLASLNDIEGVINSILVYHCTGSAIDPSPEAARG
ncbi:chaperone NapD [Thiocystis violascens]|uniref:Uncharacterized protein involved in formation of periplasmic nitrate reductase n=1 Tax=Thiocystis violascens (strain ATCC 17096 / DSM 198 / 6111) TaxID=765911 RepID=I3YGE1_THIV6|nr:chaperone NapD [Thiocystis violascens]AFL76059.1 uncharacterized protein involved in formation of periplasmic nitrate reductase [Thiocystis violascens DSM 198]